MKLCVYAIMRDEEANVAEWAETTGDADTRFVLDTGSTDHTREELAIHHIALAEARFDPFRFDDARNCALALAPSADLYLRLDADERLQPGWRDQLDAVYDPRIGRYRYRVVNLSATTWGTHTREDCHVRAGHRWKYPTHEVLIGDGIVAEAPLMTVEHLGANERRPHHVDNLKTLQRAVNEYPGDHRMAFYWARELWYTNNWDACRVAMMGFLDMRGGWPAERCEGYRILAAIDDYPERWLWKAVGEHPQRREPWVDLARLCLREGEVSRAALMFTEAEARDGQMMYTTDPAAWGAPFEDLRDEIARQLAEQNAALWNRLIVLRLTGSPGLEGVWMEVQGGREPSSLQDGEQVVEMVATGNVEWEDDQCAEVYVPTDKLPLWRAEHDIEADIP